MTPNTVVTYDMTVTNNGTTPLGMNQYGVPVVISDAIPTGTTYVAGTADDNLVLPSGMSSSRSFGSSSGGRFVRSG